ncbi:MAG: hypothetical protein P1P80_10340 [ANME-2 cluster archaeon]|nr:hypothetical protein [ANME-2 cluster archaeon]
MKTAINPGTRPEIIKMGAMIHELKGGLGNVCNTAGRALILTGMVREGLILRGVLAIYFRRRFTLIHAD